MSGTRLKLTKKPTRVRLMAASDVCQVWGQGRQGRKYMSVDRGGKAASRISRNSARILICGDAMGVVGLKVKDEGLGGDPWFGKDEAVLPVKRIFFTFPAREDR